MSLLNVPECGRGEREPGGGAYAHQQTAYYFILVLDNFRKGETFFILMIHLIFTVIYNSQTLILYVFLYLFGLIRLFYYLSNSHLDY